MKTNSNNQVPPMELPNLPEEQSVLGNEVSGVNNVTEISAAKALESNSSATQTPPPQQFDTNLGPQPAVALYYDPVQKPDPQASGQGAQAPQIADDTDLIEKEWVIKAKQIVDQTKSDPRKQNKEINKMKAQYLRLRYNKEVKLVEE